jgi:hypothetical protein
MEDPKIEKPSEPDQAGSPVTGQNLFEFLQASPLARWIAETGIEFEVEREQDLPRDIDFD